MSLVVVGVLVMASCVPVGSTGGGGTTTPPPPPAVLITPTSGHPGSFVNVAPPAGDCLNPKYQYSTLQATLTMFSLGVVVTTGYQYIGRGPSISNYTASDPFVRLYIPPYVATGKYLVYLTCYNYLNSYQYSPATFTVTPS